MVMPPITYHDAAKTFNEITHDKNKVNEKNDDDNKNKNNNKNSNKVLKKSRRNRNK